MKIFDYVLSCVYKYTCVETVLSAMELRKFIFVEKGLNKIKKVEKEGKCMFEGEEIKKCILKESI